MPLWERRMEERALRERWPISEERRQQIVERLCKVIETNGVDERHLIGAAKALIAADKLNLERIKHEHATHPDQDTGEDFAIDLGTPDDQTQQPDGPPA